jgi:release factor glutamine methyltransferase
MATVGDLLTAAIQRLRAAGSDTPRLDAELLLARAVGTDRVGIIAHPDAPVGPEAATRFADDLDRRATGEPVAYIRGIKEFHGVALEADARALIPRPETELLVELAERDVLARLAAGSRTLAVADVGTGSGAIAIALAATLRRRRALDGVRILCTDASSDALALAMENAAAHGLLDALEFAVADLLPPGAGTFDLVVANLPYIPSSVVDGLGGSARFEPRSALDGGPDGLDVVRRLLALLPDVLRPGGVAFLEIGADQGASATAAAAGSLPGVPVAVLPDLAGRPRVLRIG